MKYTSTRDKTVAVSAAQAIAQGISADGGLFVPKSLPKLSMERLASLVHKNYKERACDILADFLDDFTTDEIRRCVEGAYGGESFDDPRVAPMSRLDHNTYLLELWHGPTCAFKDMALQLLPHLLTVSMSKVGQGREAAILVATSGDTGKAALEGFKDVDGTKILVFYPQDGVSAIQKLQMQTQEGGNVGVCGVYGNFDDAQTGVKAIFTDAGMQQRLTEKNMMFSSANSINWGRLVPQIVYYISAYCDLVLDEEIALGDKINIAVPTGNFGNILASYYAGEMGLPVNQFICASNVNKVLTDFFATGTYDRRRDFIMTSSPSMDILISSNLERLLFSLCGQDDSVVRAMMEDLADKGVYTVPEQVRRQIQGRFWAGYCEEENTARTIKDTFGRYDYLCDTHTAVAVKVYQDYVRETGDQTKTIVASTASPYKFAESILAALRGRDGVEDEFAQIQILSQMTNTPIPLPISELKDKNVRFNKICTQEEMHTTVSQMLGI